MLVGLLHTHRSLAYLVLLVALVNLILVLSGANTKPGLAKGVLAANRYALVWAGRINLGVGIGLFAVLGTYPLTTWWIWVSLLLWGPVEALSKRSVHPELEAVVDGGQASSRLTIGLIGQLVAVVIIFGLMSARP